MEYVFGTNGNAEILKTKGPEHTNLTGYQQITRGFPNEKITDNFRIVRKIDSKKDPSGNCYDWYEIDRHYRTIDKTGQLVEEEARNAANIDYLSMMTGVDLPDGDETEGDGDE